MCKGFGNLRQRAGLRTSHRACAKPNIATLESVSSNLLPILISVPTGLANTLMRNENPGFHRVDPETGKRRRGWRLPSSPFGRILPNGENTKLPPIRPVQDGKHKVEQRSPAKK